MRKIAAGILGGFVAGVAGVVGLYKPRVQITENKRDKDSEIVETTIPNCDNVWLATTSQEFLQPQGGDAVAAKIKKATDLCLRLKDEVGTPGLIVGVSVNGKDIWQQGFGYSDVENRVECHPKTVMRIGSISKSITMAIAAKLWEDGKLDIDKPIQEYIPKYPQKTFEGKNVTITTRHLMSHLSGIRHYGKDIESYRKKKEPNEKNNTEKEVAEFYSKVKFESTQKVLELFMNDELIYKPGTKYVYTTHGFAVVSAVIEGASNNKPFADIARQFFVTMGLQNTYLDEHEPLLYGRARFYYRNKKSDQSLKNSPYVDSSYKWAGGGMLSTVGDLVKFGNAMLSSYQEKCDPKCYLKGDTVHKMWTIATPSSEDNNKSSGYGMGWAVCDKNKNFSFGKDQKYFVNHSGGSVGAASILLILPNDNSDFNNNNLPVGHMPEGVVVAMLTNLQCVAMSKVAFEIAKIFQE